MSPVQTIKICLIALCLVVQPSAQAGDCDSLVAVRWLVGDWLFEDNKVTISESWRQVSANTLEGYGRTQTASGDSADSGPDSKTATATETLRLVEMSNAVFYLAKVRGNDMPVPFKLTACSGNTAVFENHNHDFPKVLAYRLTDNTHLLVSVTGEGGEGFEINYTRSQAK